jgi:hypothetical protein
MPRAERDLEHLLRPATSGVGLDVAATEPDAAQLVWSHLPEGRHELRIGGRRIVLDGAGGPGGLVVDDLTPDTEYRAELRDAAGIVGQRGFRTPAGPRGPRLFRVATISDLHLGRDTHHATRNALGATVAHHGERGSTRSHGTGAVATDELDPIQDRAFRCARAAVDEAIAWGAELIVVKGDVCEETSEQTWDLAASLLTDLPVPVMTIPGNHDTGTLRHFEPEHGAAARGLEVIRGVGHRDVPGLRIIAVDSTIPDSGWGDVARHADQVAALARDAAGGVLVATHHQPQRFATSCGYVIELTQGAP